MEISRIQPSKKVSSYAGFRPVVAKGGTESIITYKGITYKLHVFTTVGNDSLYIYDAGSDKAVEYLVVAGGGGGGMDMGGGGGGGGVLMGRYSVNSLDNISITVGAGGYGGPSGSGGYRTDGTGPQPSAHQFTVSATNGGNSVFGSLTAIGGGYGASSYYGYTPNYGYPGSGGSGGGPSGYSDGGTRAGGTGTAGQGYAGGNGGGQYYSGGGGGAGGPGTSSTAQPNGGPGILCDILGYELYWGGGGGGSAYSAGNGGNGGIGGGGGGACGTSTGGAGYNPGMPGLGGANNVQANTRGGDAGANTGGGGGGGHHYNIGNRGGDGGSGIVVVRYPLEQPLPIYPTNGLTLLLDANNPSSYPGSGTVWYDLSGNGNNFNIAASAYQGSTFKYMNFGGGYGCAKNGADVNFASSNNATIIMFSQISTSTANWRTGTRGYSNDHQIIIQSDNALGMYDNDGAGFISSGVNVTNASSRNLTTSWNMLTWRMSSLAPQYEFFVNNNSAAGSITNANAAFTRGFGSIGAYHGGSTDPLTSTDQFWGSIGLFMVYNRKLSATEISQVYDAFRKTYGL